MAGCVRVRLAAAQVQTQYVAWQRWLAGDVDPGTGTNWYTWNREQLAKMRNDDGNVTDAWR
jgi:1,3-beta-glucan synthase